MELSLTTTKFTIFILCNSWKHLIESLSFHFSNYIVSFLVQVISWLKIWIVSIGWYSSVDWAWAWEPKDCQFNSQSGHMPGLQARSPVGSVQPHTDVPLPLFLPYLLSKNKQIKSFLKIWIVNIFTWFKF